MSQASEKSSLDSSQLIVFQAETICHYRNTSTAASESECCGHNSGGHSQI